MTEATRVASARTSVLMLGLSTAVAQALLLREAMAATGGSEMAWGVVMAVWLAGMAAGARMGVHVGSETAAHWTPPVVLTLAAGGVLLFRATPALIGAAPGEALTTASTTWVWLVAVLPAAMCGGLAFPILAQALGQAGGGRAYALDAAGALAGGTLLTVALVISTTAASLCIAWGAVMAVVMLRRSRIAAVAIGVAAVLAAGPLAESLARASWRWSKSPGELGHWDETRQQQLAVSAGKPTAVYANGELLASYPDPYGVLPRAHLLMLLHPRPRRVFAVGCAATGAVEALARHPVELLRVVEDDPDLLRHLPEWYGSRMSEVLARPEVQGVAADPLRAVVSDEPWDLVLLLDGDPTTLRRNRTRTVEFFRRCRSQMAADGVLVVRTGVSDTYLGGAGGRLLAVLASTVHDVFEKLAFVPGEEVLLVAGGPSSDLTLDPGRLQTRWASLGLGGAELIPEMIPLLVDPDRAAELEQRIDLGAPANTIRHPRAVVLASGLHEGRGLPALLRLVRAVESAGTGPLAATLAAMVVVLLTITAFPRLAAPAAAGVVGFCSMGWWLLLLAIWQASRGSVYSEVGALTALFMAGLAVGAGVASRWTRPERWIALLIGAGSVQSLLIASGLAFGAPAPVVALLLGTAGVLTGLAFPGLASLGARGTRHGTGIAFAADEAGAALAALAVGIFLIPWAGLTATAIGLAVLQIATIPVVAAAARKSRG